MIAEVWDCEGQDKHYSSWKHETQNECPYTEQTPTSWCPGWSSIINTIITVTWQCICFPWWAKSWYVTCVLHFLIIKVTYQEKWAPLIFIYHQKWTQFPIPDKVIVHLTKENTKNINIYTQREIPETMVPSQHLVKSILLALMCPVKHTAFKLGWTL